LKRLPDGFFRNLTKPEAPNGLNIYDTEFLKWKIIGGSLGSFWPGVMEIIHKVGVLFIQNGRAIDFTTFDTI
jgi:hypothetical protein